jgi:hypothetical protein
MDMYSLIVCLLGLGTVATALVGWLLWAKTGSVAFPVGMAAFYFWTFHGGWAISRACETGQIGNRLAGVFTKLFPAAIDESYAWAVAIYAVFVVSVGVAAYLTVTGSRLTTAPTVLWVSHERIVLVCGLMGLVSVACAWDLLVSAIRYGVPPYLLAAWERDGGLLLVLHQLLARGSIVVSSLGCAAWAGGPRGRYIAGRPGLVTGLGYAIVIGGMYTICTAMGNKNELLQSLITGVVFYLGNSVRPRIGLLGALACGCFAAIAYIDVIRGRDLLDVVDTLSFAEMGSSAIAILESNEQFAAHLSMYGALAYEIPITYGSSVLSLLLSVVPRALWETRPADVYLHYASAVHAVGPQGFTVHHATGWYLNFGIPGVVLGGALFGWIWASCFNRLNPSRRHRSSLITIGEYVVFFTVTGGIPMLVRAGPEGYKPLLLNCLVVPVAILMLARTSQSKGVAADRTAHTWASTGPTPPGGRRSAAAKRTGLFRAPAHESR